MPKPRTVPVVEVVGVDLDHRPASHCDALDPVSAVVQNVKGDRRRHMIRWYMNPDKDEQVVISPRYLADELDEAQIRLSEQRDFNWGWGERLPAYLPGEREIARLCLYEERVLVISFRARRLSRGYGYRVVSDPAFPLVLRRKTSRSVLTSRELVMMMDEMEYKGWSPPREEGYSFFDTYVRRRWSCAPMAPEALLEFLSVESAIHPNLACYFAARLEGWVEYVGTQTAEGG
jgi:hypothetical protein